MELTTKIYQNEVLVGAIEVKNRATAVAGTVASSDSASLVNDTSPDISYGAFTLDEDESGSYDSN